MFAQTRELDMNITLYEQRVTNGFAMMAEEFNEKFYMLNSIATTQNSKLGTMKLVNTKLPE